MNSELERTIVEIVSYAGDAKSDFIETINNLIENKDINETQKVYEAGCESFHKAHSAHMAILQKFASGESIDGGILLIHAECQLMSAEDFMTLASQAIEVRKKINDK